MEEKSLTFVVTVGPGEIAYQALFLVNSILDSHEDPDIVSFVAREEKEDIDTEVLEEIDRKSRMVEGEIPDPDYPLSANHAALIEASKISESSHLLSLDTDTLVLGEIKVHETSDADLFIKPADNGNHYWPSEESEEEWKKLAEKFGLQVPHGTTFSTVDGKEIRPYYNGGVILVRNGTDFPERWRDLSKELRNEITHEYFAEMVALAFLAQEYKVEELTEKYNKPFHFRFWAPSDTRILHYNKYKDIMRLPNPELRSKVKETGIMERIDEVKGPRLYYNFFYRILRALKIKFFGFS